MKIAVTGGFGFIGHHLVNRLLKDKHTITILSYARSDISRFTGDVSIARGSLENFDSLVSAFTGQQIVFHLVGIIAETKSQTFEGTVVKGTENVVKAAKKAGVRKIIYLSAMGTSAQAEARYHQSKYKAEQAVITSGIQYTIFRPSLVYGQGDGFVSLLTKMMRFSPFVPVIGNGRYKMQPVYIDDLTGVMSHSLTKSETENEIIEIGGPEKLEYLQILYILKSVLQKKRMNIFLPVAVMRVIAGLMEKVIKPAPLTTDQIIMMEAGNTGSNEKLKRIFNIEPVPFEEGLRKYMR